MTATAPAWIPSWRGCLVVSRLLRRSTKVNIARSAVCNNKRSTIFVMGQSHGQHRIRTWTPRMRKNRERVCRISCRRNPINHKNPGGSRI